MKRLIEYEKHDEISKRNTTKYKTKQMYDEHIENGCTKPMTKPQ